ncbi:MAG: hypothetical protein N2544_10290 [Burkholderiales bacterium]|nr:hypothetical protein [Burkholderiales bacterium]
MSRARTTAAAALAAALLAPAPADAQLYRWRDPRTGALNYSNVPPPWYRRGEGAGPPVETIVGGKVVEQRAAAGAQAARAAMPAAAPFPANATDAQAAEVVIALLGLRDALAGMSRSVENALAASPAWARASPQLRETALVAARASFLPDKLAAAMVASLAAEARVPELRAFYDAMQSPLAQRMAALERERMRMLSGPDTFAAPVTRPATSGRAALIEELERAAAVSELAATAAATAQALALGAIPRATPLDAEYEFERAKAAVARDLRPRLLLALQFVYEPASDEELREYVALNRRPEVARVNPAIARAYGRAIGGAFAEWFAALARASAPARAAVR